MKKPKRITNKQAEKVRKYLSYKDRLIFDFSIETGLRISDVLNIKAYQLRKKMKIRESKTKKIKAVEISDGLFLRLKDFISRDKNVYAFSSPRTRYKHLHRSTYHLHLKKAYKLSGVNLSAHSARKLYAMNIFRESGRDIFKVQRALNHKYVSTTCTYLDIDYKKLIRKAAKL